MNRPRLGLSSSALKLLACVLMLVDHVGMIFFPTQKIFRIIGRLAFPIFAYLISEGCRYTRNKLKRFLLLFLPGVVFEIAYVLYTHKIQGNIFLTFSASVLAVYALQLLKQSIANRKALQITFSALLLGAVLVAIYPLSVYFDLDYGFMGILLPLYVTLFEYREGKDPVCFKKLDKPPVKLLAFFCGLLLLVYTRGFTSLQAWCLLAILPLCLYNGTVGSKKFKYGFYIFYPLHLLILELIDMLLG